jgi:hypothetical protein
MGSANAQAWHDCMCQGQTLVATLVAKRLLVGVTCTLVIM